jgi:hypothetical protein
MASVSGPADKSSKGKEILVATNVVAFQGKNNQIHAPESNLDAEKDKIWKSQVLILYPVFDIIYAFLGPYPNST